MKPLVFLVALACPALALAVENDALDFKPLFNGKDLSGWVNANCAPETWSVRDGVIFCTGKPTGALRTERHYENFVLEVEWRHLSSGGNSGVFIWGTPIAAPGVPFLRGIEVQVLDHGYNAKGKNEWYTTHGDVFPIHGATMKPFGRHNGQRSFPSHERSLPSPQWNHYRIEANNGVLKLRVNGEEVSGGENCNYRKGYLALESEGAPVEFRNLKIAELPATNTPAELTAPLDAGWKVLYNGADLRGWSTPAPDRWQPSDWRLLLKNGDGKAGETLWTEQDFADFELILDVMVPKDGKAEPALELSSGAVIPLTAGKAGQFGRYAILVKGAEATVSFNGAEGKKVALPEAGQRLIGIKDVGAAVEFANIYVRTVE